MPPPSPPPRSPFPQSAVSRLSRILPPVFPPSPFPRYPSPPSNRPLPHPRLPGAPSQTPCQPPGAARGTQGRSGGEWRCALGWGCPWCQDHRGGPVVARAPGTSDLSQSPQGRHQPPRCPSPPLAPASAPTREAQGTRGPGSPHRRHQWLPGRGGGTGKQGAGRGARQCQACRPLAPGPRTTGERWQAGHGSQGHHMAQPCRRQGTVALAQPQGCARPQWGAPDPCRRGAGGALAALGGAAGGGQEQQPGGRWGGLLGPGRSGVPYLVVVPVIPGW